MDSYLMLALAEGFGESVVSPLLDPLLEPVSCLQIQDGPPPEPLAVPPRVAVRLADPGLAGEAAEVRQRAQDEGLVVLTPDAPPYPERLREAWLRPLVLFARGDVSVLSRTPALTLVGSRTPTPYGRSAAEQFASALARAGVVLWSGLARGIDAAAHRACIDAGTPTVAVLAGGLDSIYPPEHAELAQTIADGGGCLLSELPPGRRARRGHFVRRNRILAGGAPAVLVIEAGLVSGALHTAYFAVENDAQVYALPGPWQSERSQGCHRMIAEGAFPAESPEGLLRDLGVSGQGTGQDALGLTCSADEQAVLAVLRKGPRPSDLVQRESGLERAGFLRALLALESRAVVRRLPGDLWARVK